MQKASSRRRTNSQIYFQPLFSEHQEEDKSNIAGLQIGVQVLK